MGRVGLTMGSPMGSPRNVPVLHCRTIMRGYVSPPGHLHHTGGDKIQRQKTTSTISFNQVLCIYKISDGDCLLRKQSADQRILLQKDCPNKGHLDLFGIILTLPKRGNISIYLDPNLDLHLAKFERFDVLYSLVASSFFSNLNMYV